MSAFFFESADLCGSMLVPYKVLLGVDESQSGSKHRLVQRTLIWFKALLCAEERRFWWKHCLFRKSVSLFQGLALCQRLQVGLKALLLRTNDVVLLSDPVFVRVQISPEVYSGSRREIYGRSISPGEKWCLWLVALFCLALLWSVTASSFWLHWRILSWDVLHFPTLIDLFMKRWR